MKKIIMTIFFCLLGLALWGDDAKDIQKILDIINKSNQFSDVYTGKIQIANFEPDKDPILSSNELYARGLDNSLLVTLSPAKDKGKKFLLKDDKIWFYFPKVKRTIVMNPTSTLFGSVSIGDVVTPPVLDIYDFEEAKKIKVDGQEVLAVSFSAKDRAAPYGKVIYHYRDEQIVYSESYTRSGIKLKMAYFSDFIENTEGLKYATKIKLINAINPRYYSLMKISDLSETKEIPDYYFTPEGLERIR